MPSLNYKHLHYFWVVAHEGSITRAANRLDVAVQTISGQLSLLERQLGRALFNSQGRGLVLSDAGRLALGYADQIFRLGDELTAALDDFENEASLRLRVGITDGIPKLLAFRLLSAAASGGMPLRLVCDEGEVDDLLGDLALQRLDVVLTDRPPPDGGNLRLGSTPLGDFAIGLYASPALAAALPDSPDGRFPARLAGAPMLLPTRHHALRDQIERWLAQHGVKPRIAGEFEDSALLDTFGREGLGLFPGPLALSSQINEQLGGVLVGALDGVSEQIWAITSQRRIRHPGVETLIAAAQQGLAV